MNRLEKLASWLVWTKMHGDEHGVEEWLPGGTAVRTTVDLNEVDFEELIGLGISVGQAARFISQRERRGGIGALTDLDGFYGLAPGVRDILRRHGQL